MKITQKRLRQLITEELEAMQEQEPEVEVDPEEAIAELAEDMEQAVTELHRKLEELEPQIRKVFQEVPGRVLNRKNKADALESMDDMDLDTIMRFLNYITRRYNPF